MISGRHCFHNVIDLGKCFIYGHSQIEDKSGERHKILSNFLGKEYLSMVQGNVNPQTRIGYLFIPLTISWGLNKDRMVGYAILKGLDDQKKITFGNGLMIKELLNNFSSFLNISVLQIRLQRKINHIDSLHKLSISYVNHSGCN